MGDGFSNPVAAGGGALIRDAIHSRGYVAGVSGWSINADGSAEFNSITARGSLLVVNGNQEIEIAPTGPAPLPAQPFIRFNPYTPSFFDGFITSYDLFGAHDQGQLAITAPFPDTGASSSHIELTSDVAGTGAGRSIEFDTLTVRGPVGRTYTPVWTATAGTTTLGVGASLTGGYVDGPVTSFWIRFVTVAGTTQSVGGAGWIFSLPVTPESTLTDRIVVTMRLLDAATGNRYVATGLVDAGAETVRSFYSHGTAVQVSNTAPFALGAGNVYTINGSYEPVGL